MAIIDATQFSMATDRAGYLAQLEDAIFRGVDYVSYGGDQVKYKSLDDMLRIRDLLRIELGIPNPPDPRRRRRARRAVFGRS